MHNDLMLYFLALVVHSETYNSTKQMAIHLENRLELVDNIILNNKHLNLVLILF